MVNERGNKKVIIWGAGEFGRNAVECYIPELISVEVLAITDKDSSKWGQRICNIPVICYKDINKLDYDKILIFSPKYEDEIYHFIQDECKVLAEKIEIVKDCAYFIYKRVEERYKNVNINTIDDFKKKEAIQFLKEHDAGMFCYGFPEKYLSREAEVFFDDNEQMNYVLHDGKRLYLPNKLPNRKIMQQYYNLLCMEQDLESPHLYQSEQVHVNEGDILLDVGAAEGFFTLSVIDKISYAYLIEAGNEWEKALQATFRPYNNKVQIISKFASDEDDEDEITIDSIVEDKRVDFIKMDIEGAEQKALKGAINTLKKYSVKCSICTYHNENDFDEITSFFNNMSYQCESSEGYILCGGMWEKDNRDIDFRRGVIRTWK